LTVLLEIDQVTGKQNKEKENENKSECKNMNSALILAGGLGLRMNQAGEPPKQFHLLAEKPVLIHTLERFEKHPEIDAICVACLPTWDGYLSELIESYRLKKVRWLIEGGENRQQSVFSGLCTLESACPPETIVLVHDGVRPFITNDIISQNIETAQIYGNAMTGMRSTDSLVVSQDDFVADIAMERDRTFTIQTPQTYRLGEGLALYRQASARGMTNTINCCELFIALGQQIHIVNGLKTNIKLTTPDDIAYLEFLHSIFRDQEVTT
jgi:2-C-methyl-D-erythritol 4-phosphate cytidylyltransferase